MRLTAGQLWLPNGEITLMTHPWGMQNLHTSAPVFIIGTMPRKERYSILTWEILTEFGVMYSYDSHIQRYIFAHRATLLMSAE